MSIIFSQVRTSLYEWAIANVPNGMPVIYYYANAPRPTVDYVSLYISNVNAIGWDYVAAPIDDAGTTNQTGDREFTLQIQGYGGDPLTVIENLRTSLQKQTVLDTLRANGIVFVTSLSMNDITDLVDSRYEQRATLDILFRIAQKYTDILGTIAQIELQEIVVNVDDSIVSDITVLIPETI